MSQDTKFKAKNCHCGIESLFYTQKSDPKKVIFFIFFLIFLILPTYDVITIPLKQKMKSNMAEMYALVFGQHVQGLLACS